MKSLAPFLSILWKPFEFITEDPSVEIWVWPEVWDMGLFGIPDKVIKALKALYTNTKSRVVISSGIIR